MVPQVDDVNDENAKHKGTNGHVADAGVALVTAYHAKHGNAEKHNVEEDILKQVELQEAVLYENSRLLVDLLDYGISLLNLPFNYVFELVGGQVLHARL